MIVVTRHHDRLHCNITHLEADAKTFDEIIKRPISQQRRTRSMTLRPTRVSTTTRAVEGLGAAREKRLRVALFAVIGKRGPAWDHSRSLEQQNGWREHAVFMDSLVDEGFVLLGGPLDDGRPLLIIESESLDEIEIRLAHDPWFSMGLLLPYEAHRWLMRLGKLPDRR